MILKPVDLDMRGKADDFFLDLLFKTVQNGKRDDERSRAERNPENGYARYEGKKTDLPLSLDETLRYEPGS